MEKLFRRIRSSSAIVFLSLLILQPPATFAQGIANTEGMDQKKTAFEWLSESRLGWNLGNSLDAHINNKAQETSWGNPKTSQALIDGVKAAGFDFIRVPVTWSGCIGPESSGYRIAPERLERVAEILGYIKKAQMKALINLHHDGHGDGNWLNVKAAASSSTKKKEIDAQIKAVWTQIAEYFKDYGDWLMFEGMNEIHDGRWGWGGNRNDGGLQYSIVNEWNQIFVDAVRATGGNNRYRYLGVCGYVTNPLLTLDYLVLPNDIAEDRLLVSIHCYDPSEYAIEAKYPEWGLDARNRPSGGQENHFIELFDDVYRVFIAKGIPVYLGEYGAVHQKGHEKYRRYYMEFVTKILHDRQILPIYWDNGSRNSGKESFGLFNRRNGSPYPHALPILEAMNRAVQKDYSIDDIEMP